MPDLPITGFLRIRQVLQFIPVSRSTWWAGVASGRFPAPVRLGSKLTFWRVADIRALLKKIGVPA